MCDNLKKYQGSSDAFSGKRAPWLIIYHFRTKSVIKGDCVPPKTTREEIQPRVLWDAIVHGNHRLHFERNEGSREEVSESTIKGYS